jgi:serine/threonine protein kinase
MISTSQLIASRYRLSQLVGRGGMSDVYRAVDAETGQEVAVKIVRSGQPATARRVAREAHAMQALDHPNLVRLLASGTLGDEAYLVMEFVEGETLADRVQAGPMEPAEVERVAVGVSAALAYVHAAGVVHRDVKPANVLLGTDGRIRLGDFGIARLADAETLTLAGSTLGTVAYMAPEQLHNHRVGPPADIWSLGIVLLECLTGRRWYEGSAAQIIARRLREPISVPQDLPAPWPNLLDTMLRPSPAERVSAADIGQSLAAGRVATLPDWGVPALGAPAGRPAHDLPATMVDQGGETPADTEIDPNPPRLTNQSGLTNRPGLTNPSGRPRHRRPGRHRLAIAAAVVAATAVVLILLLGTSPKPSPARAPSTTAQNSTTVPPGVAAALATLTTAVGADEAAGTVTPAAGTSLLGLARQAVSEAGAGRTDLASFDLQQAAAVVASGPAQHTIAGSAAGSLRAGLVVLGQLLGLASAATLPTVPPPTTPPPPGPGHDHHGGGKSGGDKGGGGDQGN